MFKSGYFTYTYVHGSSCFSSAMFLHVHKTNKNSNNQHYNRSGNLSTKLKHLHQALGCLLSVFAVLFFLINATNVEDVVAPDQHFTQVTSKLTVNELFSVSKLKIHVAVNRHKVTLVFHSPFELDHHWLSC